MKRIPGVLRRKTYMFNTDAPGPETVADVYPTSGGLAPVPSGVDPELVSSELHTDLWPMHAPVLDLDFPAYLVPSSTPGHSHLYLERPMSEDQYFALLTALGEAGILEKGYVNACIARGFSVVRTPWTTKEKE